MSRVLLVFGELRHGGLQTLIVRLANYLAGQGRVVAVSVPGGELAAKLLAGIDRLTWTEKKQAIRQAADWVGASSEPVTMISFDPISAALGLAIEAGNAGRVPLVHLSGVYHPRSFFMTGERKDRVLLNRLVAKAVGDPLIFYMNAECRAEHERRWRTPLTASAIIPLPIEERPPAWKPAGSGQLRIISVGRLVDFKTYNLAAPEVARECKEAGVPVSWDIYGSGPLQDSIAKAISENEVADSVRLNGDLPYADLVTIVGGYDLFVGMGTAALEAAMIGVPAIVATESELRRSYGFVDQLPFGNVGEQQGFLPPYDLSELIRAYAVMNSDDRAALSARCRQAVRSYSLNNCVAALDALAAAGIKPPSLAFKRAVSALYEGATASGAANLVRRAMTLMRRDVPAS